MSNSEIPSRPYLAETPSRVPGIYRWTDCGYMCGWRLQAHYRSQRYRLLTPSGQMVCGGERDVCQSHLQSVIEREQLARPTQRLVVLVHGLARNAWTMAALGRYLSKHWSDTEVILYQYASTTAPVVDHARRLTEFLEYGRDASEVHFVGHSLGNIVLRRAFRMAEQGQWQLPRLGRHVMLGPPNQGSQIAQRLERFFPVAWFTGAPFMQLGRDWQSFRQELATPPCPFGVIAGRIGLIDRWHPMLEGPSDVIVRVAETQLEGQADTMEVNVPHAWLMHSPQVQAACLQFLRTGRFRD